jgi:hypothetical protein
MKSRVISPRCRWPSVLVVAIGLWGIAAIPASAGEVDITVRPQCTPCSYSITVFGIVDTAGPFTVVTHVHFRSQTTGAVTTVDRSISVSGPGNYSVTVPDIPSPVDCADTFDVTAEASLTFPSGFTAMGDFSGATLGNCSPPQGKTFDIGPSSMEGHLLIRPGDWISGGYSFVFVDGGHAATTVTVTSKLTLPFRCADGTTGEFVINLGTHDYDVPAGNKTWQPTGDANSVLSWAGAGPAPEGCGPGNIMDNSKGAIWEATIAQNPDTGSLLNWRFKYRDPNAKGKGNVNCLDTLDPRRSKADVCGASWSGTVRDP